MKIARALYDQILRHGERAYPEEACGFLVADADGRVVEVVPIANAAERMKAERPEEFTRDARTGYVMDATEQYRAMRAAEDAGRSIAGIYHSHADVGAYFSAEDKARAAPDGEPFFRDTVYVVADVRAARALGAMAFVWDGPATDFVEHPLEILES